MNKYLRLTLILTSLSLIGCAPHTKHHAKETVKEYRQHQSDNSWLYYYILFNNSNNTYYYTSSPTPLTSFDSTSWQSSATKPAVLEFNEGEQVEEVGEQTVDTADLGGAGSQIENSLDSMEGVPDSSESAADSSSSSDSGSSGGDSGGGDSGGGGGGD